MTDYKLPEVTTTEEGYYHCSYCGDVKDNEGKYHNQGCPHHNHWSYYGIENKKLIREVNEGQNDDVTIDRENTYEQTKLNKRE